MHEELLKSESSNRIIPLAPKAITLLQMLEANAENEWVVIGDDGGQLSYDALRYQTQRLCKAAEIPYKEEHVFCHTFATNYCHKGIDVNILSKLPGHADANLSRTTSVCIFTKMGFMRCMMRWWVNKNAESEESA